MKFRVLLPTEVLLEEDVDRITGEGEDGFFGILPRHVDMTTSLAAGILSYVTSNGEEFFVAADTGILVKCADTVTLSTNRGVVGRDLERIQKKIEGEFLKLDEDGKVARGALARLEMGVIRRFMELQQA